MQMSISQGALLFLDLGILVLPNASYALAAPETALEGSDVGLVIFAVTLTRCWSQDLNFGPETGLKCLIG